MAYFKCPIHGPAPATIMCKHLLERHSSPIANGKIALNIMSVPAINVCDGCLADFNSEKPFTMEEKSEWVDKIFAMQCAKCYRERIEKWNNARAL